MSQWRACARNAGTSRLTTRICKFSGWTKRTEYPGETMTTCPIDTSCVRRPASNEPVPPLTKMMRAP